MPRVRDCLERTTSQTTKLHKQTVNHISPLDLGEYKYLRNIGLIIGPLVRKQQCTGRECSHLVGDLERRVSTRDQIRNRSSGLFEHVNCSLLPPPLSNLRQKKLRAREPWSHADQRDRQSSRTAGHGTNTPGFRRISYSRQIDGFLLSDCFVAASTPGFDSSCCWL